MWLVVQKELKELLRDRKTLFFMIALPMLIFPAIFGALGHFSSKAITDAQNKVLKFAVVGEHKDANFITRLQSDTGFELVSLPEDGDYRSHVKSKLIDFALELDENLTSEVLTAGQSTKPLSQ